MSKTAVIHENTPFLVPMIHMQTFQTV